jgi:hypothetical protein
MCMVYIRILGQGNHQRYGHVWCIYTVLATILIWLVSIHCMRIPHMNFVSVLTSHVAHSHIAHCTFPLTPAYMMCVHMWPKACVHVAKSVCTQRMMCVHLWPKACARTVQDVCMMCLYDVCVCMMCVHLWPKACARTVQDVCVWCVCVYDVCALVAKSLCTHRTSVHAAYKSMNVKYQWCAIRSFGTFNTVKFCGKYDVARVGQHHMYTMYTRCFWKGNYQSYGHVRRIYTVLANYVYVPRRWNLLVSVVWFRECGTV